MAQKSNRRIFHGKTTKNVEKIRFNRNVQRKTNPNLYFTLSWLRVNCWLTLVIDSLFSYWEHSATKILIRPYVETNGAT